MIRWVWVIALCFAAAFNFGPALQGNWLSIAAVVLCSGIAARIIDRMIFNNDS